MPVKKLKGIIEKEAELKAAEIISQARKDHDLKINEEKKKQKQALADFEEKAKKQMEQKFDKEIANAKTNQKLEILKAKHNIINQVFDLALKKAKKSKKYSQFIKQKITETLKKYPKSTVIFAKSDKAIASKIKLPKTVKVQFAEFFGGVKIKPNNKPFEFDFSLESRISLLKETKTKEISNNLFR